MTYGSVVIMTSVQLPDKSVVTPKFEVYLTMASTPRWSSV